MELYGETEQALRVRVKKISWAVEWAMEKINKKQNVQPQVEKRFARLLLLGLQKILCEQTYDQDLGSRTWRQSVQTC